MAGAHLTDPAVLAAFRLRLAEFQRDSHTALGGVVHQYHTVLDRLSGELRTYWKVQLRRRDEAWGEAKRRYLMARADVEQAARGRGGGKHSCDEELLELRKAERRRNEAEEKLAAIEQWLTRVHQDGGPLMAQCRGDDLALDDLARRGQQALERMERSVEGYHAVVVPPPSSSPAAGDRP